MSPYKLCKKVWNPLGFHVHHVVPKKYARKVLGWSEDKIDDWSNLSVLTYEDHQLIHQELSEVHPSLKLASTLMNSKTADRQKEISSCGGKIGGKITAERYPDEQKEQGSVLGNTFGKQALAAYIEANPDHCSNSGKLGSEALKQMGYYGSDKHLDSCRNGGIAAAAVVFTPEHQRKAGKLGGAVRGEQLRGKPITKSHSKAVSEANTNLVFWNNGEVNKRSRTQPDGFVRGRLAHKHKETL